MFFLSGVTTLGNDRGMGQGGGVLRDRDIPTLPLDQSTKLHTHTHIIRGRRRRRRWQIPSLCCQTNSCQRRERGYKQDTTKSSFFSSSIRSIGHCVVVTHYKKNTENKQIQIRESQSKRRRRRIKKKRSSCRHQFDQEIVAIDKQDVRSVSQQADLTIYTHKQTHQQQQYRSYKSTKKYYRKVVMLLRQ